MPINRKSWDDFWSREGQPAVSWSAETWHDEIWRYTLTRWYDLFCAEAPGRRMLECGCGSARVSEFMAERGYECTMLDYSEHALALASDRFRSKSIPGRFVRGDIENLSLADGRFDIVYSGGVLEFFSDVKRPVAEMARVLRTGGLFTAGMVPLKFSIQTIADFERTVAYSARNVLRGRFRDAFALTKMVDAAEGVKPWTLSDYLHACDCAGLVDVTGRVTNPFPQLALPRVLNRRYARLMKVLTPGWRRFDESVARWTDVWGLGYTIHGRKASQHRA